MENNQNINKAYQDGKKAGKEWVESFRGTGRTVLMPEFPQATDMINMYYQKGFKETVEELTFSKNRTPQFLNTIRKNLKPNIIDRLMKEKGNNFHVKLGEKGEFELINFAERVLTDLCNSRIIDMEKYKHVFENIKILNYITNECNKKLYYHQVVVQSLQSLIEMGNTNETINGFLNYHLANQHMYQLIFNRLTDFMTSINNGLFDPNPIIQAQKDIHKEGWSRIGKNPYVKTRVW